MEKLSRIGKKMSRHKSGNTNAEQKTRDIQKMRSKVSSECKAEYEKYCRTKSLKKERKWNTLRYRRSLAVGEEGT